MIEEIITGYDAETFCKFLRSKFASFSESHVKLTTKNDFQLIQAQQLGIVKTLAGPNGSNLPLIVVAAKLADGEKLKERSSRLKQFKFAKQVLDQAMANLAPGVDGVITQGLFVFHDDAGNFRLSLVFGKAEGAKLGWSTKKRLSFHVEAGAGNKTFRDRMSLPWDSFDKLKEAFSVEKLTKEFYSRLFDWYQWALSDEMGVTYPNDTDRDDDDRDISEHIIRLITRLMFVWFLKQRRLVPGNLFDPVELKKILKTFNPTSGDNYYQAILQNLFFATLNSEISERAFATQTGDRTEHFDIKTFYRYPKEFAIPETEVLKLFAMIPFLNGGLFECLDRGKNYCDGFSRNSNKIAKVPNRLFFDPDKGLIPLLQQYNFTVEENSPGDEEVALDPELLGKVFENLLGAYNPETKVAARNATGSFYTPREIVNYMVDESLIAHLVGKCGEEHAETVRRLFTDGERPVDRKLCEKMDAALVTAKILDPACGSGAFPMGILLRMVELLRILRKLPEDQSVYDLKLELIENCIYGGDIQCIAVQISKLRFFISLVCEQKPTANAKDNYGIHTLPNLETKFVAADSLIGLPKSGSELPMQNVETMKKELWAVRHRHFLARSYQEKKDLRKEDKALREKLAKELEHGGGFDTASAKLMAAWDPYDQNTSADFSDPEWMFNVRDGFDVVIGNPPYGKILSQEQEERLSKTFPAFRATKDAYVAFMLNGFAFVNTSGVECYIVPSAWLGGPSYKSLRADILKNTLWKIISLPFDMFAAAYVDTAIFLATKAPPQPKHRVQAFAYPKNTIINEFIPGPWEHIAQNAWMSVPDHKIILSLTGLSLQQKLQKNCRRTLGDVIEMRRGVLLDKALLTTRTTGNNSYLYFEGDIYRYEMNRRMHRWAEFGKNMKECPKSDKWFVGERILLRRLVNRRQRLMATLVEEDFITNKNLYSIISKEGGPRLKCILAFVNSSIISRLYIDAVSQAVKDDFPQVTISDFLALPLPTVILAKSESALEHLVDCILAAKKADPAADTTKLEDEIDELVYDLYGLTPDEKKIVKESVVRGVTPVGVEGREESDTGEVPEPKKKPAKKRKAALPASLPGWD